MVDKNRQTDRWSRAAIEVAVRAVEGIPNAMDMDYSRVDPDPTSLDIAPERDGFVTDETSPNHRRLADECIVCGQPPREE